MTPQQSSKHPKHYASKVWIERLPAQPLPNVIWTQIQFNIVRVDTLSEYDEAVTFYFTPVESGYYWVCAYVTTNTINAASLLGLQWNIGGGAAGLIYKTGTNQVSERMSISEIMYLTPTSQIGVDAYQNTGGARQINPGGHETMFMIFRIG